MSEYKFPEPVATFWEDEMDYGIIAPFNSPIKDGDKLFTADQLQAAYDAKDDELERVQNLAAEYARRLYVQEEMLAAAQSRIETLTEALKENIYYRDESVSRTRDGRWFCNGCGAEFNTPHRDDCVLYVANAENKQ